MLAILRPDLTVELLSRWPRRPARSRESIRSGSTSSPITQAGDAGRADFRHAGWRAVALLGQTAPPGFSPHWDGLRRLLTVEGSGLGRERGGGSRARFARSLELRKLASYPLPGARVGERAVDRRRGSSSRGGSEDQPGFVPNLPSPRRNTVSFNRSSIHGEGGSRSLRRLPQVLLLPATPNYSEAHLLRRNQ